MTQITQFYAAPRSTALKPFEGMQSVAILEADDGDESVVAQFYDNVLNGKNRIDHNIARFISAEPMEELLRDAVLSWPQFEQDEEVSGGDLVEWFAEFHQSAKEIIARLDSAMATNIKGGNSTHACSDAGVPPSANPTNS
ncbi:hypothetical protein LPN04_29500 [Rugamonas sp. A1-17]|nr:hypothetical protein [Rugamonas sp. A1-17]